MAANPFFQPASGSQQDRGIMYHSRMRYLKSREGGVISSKITRRKAQDLKKNINGTRNNNYVLKSPFSNIATTLSSSSNDTKNHQFPLLAGRQPCSPEKLIPPNELMTRSQAFRLASMRNIMNESSSNFMRIRKMPSLCKREDPLVLAKREEILSRIRAAELAIERNRREAEEKKKRAERSANNSEKWKRREQRKSSTIKALLDTDVSSASSLDSSASNNKNNIINAANTKSGYDNELNPNENNISSMQNLRFQPITAESWHIEEGDHEESSKEDNGDDLDSYPEGFAFLSEWKKENGFKMETKQGRV